MGRSYSVGPGRKGFPHLAAPNSSPSTRSFRLCCSSAQTTCVCFFSGGGTVDFQEFVGGLSAFSSKGAREEKLRCSSPLSSHPQTLSLFSPLHNVHPPWSTCRTNPCLPLSFARPRSSSRTVAFKVYDMDRDGFISNGELFLVLKMMVGSNLKVRLLLHLPLPDRLPRIYSDFCAPSSPAGVKLTSYSLRLPVFVAVGSTIAADRRQDHHGGRQGRVRLPPPSLLPLFPSPS
jgi:hypothetical protein